MLAVDDWWPDHMQPRGSDDHNAAACGLCKGRSNKSMVPIRAYNGLAVGKSKLENTVMK